MRLVRSILSIGLVAAGLGAAFVPQSDAFAQRAGADNEESAGQQETRRTPAMRERVYTILSEAQTCAEMDDYECAMSSLAEVREM
ncbi:MAG: hypothetical protein PVG24_14030, partial [Gammaproteobacteria bacterium]